MTNNPINTIDFSTIHEHERNCPNCEVTKLKYNTPLPCCNECEVCFCSEECRTEWHLLNKVEHDYNKLLEDLS